MPCFEKIRIKCSMHPLINDVVMLELCIGYSLTIFMRNHSILWQSDRVNIISDDTIVSVVTWALFQYKDLFFLLQIWDGCETGAVVRCFDLCIRNSCIDDATYPSQKRCLNSPADRLFFNNLRVVHANDKENLKSPHYWPFGVRIFR